MPNRFELLKTRPRFRIRFIVRIFKKQLSELGNGLLVKLVLMISSCQVDMVFIAGSAFIALALN